jgi:iron-sulfur cluster assembly protein
METAPRIEYPVTFTPVAIEHLKKAMAAQNSDCRVLRIGVVPGGCSGFQYDLDFVSEAKPGDLTFEQGGIRVAVDAAGAPKLSGTVIDFRDDGLRAGFSFQNPNAHATCGCGTSFQA